MPWYFLEQAQVAPEIPSLLTQARVPMLEHAITQPRAATGLAFQALTEHLDEVLRAIGLGHRTFTAEPTNEDGVLLLDLAPDGAVQSGAAERFADTADAFVVHVTAANQAQREANERLLPEITARVALLEAELFAAAARRHDIEEQLAVRGASDDARARLLRADFATITNDARVASCGSTRLQLIIETHPLVLAATPPRSLGRFRIAIGFTDAGIRIEAMDKIAEYPHPNVSMHGIPYLGAHRDGLIRRLAKDEYAKVVRMLLDFLEEPPTGELIPAMRPECWPKHVPNGEAAAPANPIAALAARILPHGAT